MEQRIEMVDLTDFIGPRLHLMVIGKTGSGKSSSGNSILMKKKKYFPESSLSGSETSGSRRGVTRCEDNQVVTVVDTPGLKDTRMGEEEIFEALKSGLAMSEEGIDCFLYVKKYGIRFTEEDEKTVESLKNLFGRDMFEKYCIIVYSNAEDFEHDLEEDDLTYEKWMEKEKTTPINSLFDMCNHRIDFFNNKNAGVSKDKKKQIMLHQRLTLLDKVKGMRHENENKRYSNKLFEKAAKEYRENRNMPEISKRVTDDLELLEQDLKNALALGKESDVLMELDVIQRRAQQLVEDIEGLEYSQGVLDEISEQIKTFISKASSIPEAKEMYKNLKEANVSLRKRAMAVMGVGTVAGVSGTVVGSVSFATGIIIGVFGIGTAAVIAGPVLLGATALGAGAYAGHKLYMTKKEKTRRNKAKEKYEKECQLRPNVFEKYRRVKPKDTASITGCLDNPTRVMLIGKTGQGKSSTGNSLLMDTEYFTVHDGVTVGGDTKVVGVTECDGHHLMVVDSPGFSGVDDEAAMFQLLRNSFTFCVGGIDCFIFVIKFGSKFAQNETKKITMLINMFGQNMFEKYCIVAFTGKSGKEKCCSEWIEDLKGETGDDRSHLLLQFLSTCKDRAIFLDNETPSQEQRQDLVDMILRMKQEFPDRYTSEHFQKANELFEKDNIPHISRALGVHLDRLRSDIKSALIQQPTQASFVEGTLTRKISTCDTLIKMDKIQIDAQKLITDIKSLEYTQKEIKPLIDEIEKVENNAALETVQYFKKMEDSKKLFSKKNTRDNSEWLSRSQAFTKELKIEDKNEL